MFFPPFMTIVVCYHICLCTLVAYVAKNMDPDQTALNQTWVELIVNANALLMHYFFPVIQDND